MREHQPVPVQIHYLEPHHLEPHHLELHHPAINRTQYSRLNQITDSFVLLESQLEFCPPEAAKSGIYSVAAGQGQSQVDGKNEVKTTEERQARVNWKLVLQLSLFGLAMGIATVFFIPSTVEPAFWAVIFLVCAYIIAKQCAEKRFLHGLFLGLVNSVWVTGSHVLLFRQYIANHPKEAAMMTQMPLPDSPRVMMALTGPIIGLISGVVIGLFAVLAGKILKRSPSPA